MIILKIIDVCFNVLECSSRCLPDLSLPKKHASNTKIMFGFSPANLQQIRMEKDNQFSTLKSVNERMKIFHKFIFELVRGDSNLLLSGTDIFKLKGN